MRRRRLLAVPIGMQDSARVSAAARRARPLEPFGCVLSVSPAELPLLYDGLVALMQQHGLVVLEGLLSMAPSEMVRAAARSSWDWPALARNLVTLVQRCASA